MSLFLDYYNLSLFLGGLVALLSGTAVYFSQEQRSEAFPWMLLNLSTAVWSFGYFSMIMTSDANVAKISNWILHYGAIFIPIFYLYFIVSLTKTFKIYSKVIYFIALVAIFFLFVNTSDLFIYKVIPKTPFNFAPDAGPLYVYFTAYFFAVVIFAQIILYKAITKLAKKERARLWMVFFSSLVGFIGGGSVFFLTFNIPWPPYPIALFAFYPIIITVAILRYKLFNIKIISAEILTGIIWIVLFFRTLLSSDIQEQIINGGILIFTTFFGVLLIKNVYREVSQREKIEQLAGQLENFIHFLSHEVKGILGKNRITFGSILEGDAGEVSPELKELADQSFKDTTSSVNMVMNILQSADLKNGKLIMNKANFDFMEAVKDTIEKIKLDAENKHLLIETDLNNTGSYMVFGDKEKIVEHVIKNLLLNALTYTLKGKIIVGLSKQNGKLRFYVKDTGLGLSERTKAKLFTEGGKGDESSKINVHSTGYGLFFAKGIVDAHQGKIWAESDGEGNGSTFYIELKCT